MCYLVGHTLILAPAARRAQVPRRLQRQQHPAQRRPLAPLLLLEREDAAQAARPAHARDHPRLGRAHFCVVGQHTKPKQW